jgi:pyruvate dehydrogenase E2 component (dihydrolipoyllysine-residue acetyltransferase)
VADVVMPQLGETVAEGTVTKWFKHVGDAVVRGEPLFEVSTDKVDTEIPAPVDGVLTTILIDEGTTVNVGTPLAVISGDDARTIREGPVKTPTGTIRPQVLDNKATTVAPSSERTRLSPVVRRLLGEHELNAADITGTGPNGRITREDVLVHIEALSAGGQTPPSSTRSPVVRRLLSDHNIDQAELVGTGPSKTILRRDVESYIDNHSDAPLPRETGGSTVVPFSKIRRLTAHRMTQSKATSAHTLMVREVDFEGVEMVRRAHGPAFREQEGFSLTYLPFNAVAVTQALQEYPHLNASVADDALIVYHDINLGIAVDIEDEGLVVPVIHDVARLSLTGIARAIRDLAARARSKTLLPDDMASGTFTITNPGPFDTLITGAIINQPQVAILATDGVRRRPVVVTSQAGEEAIAIHSVGMLAMSFDHRAVDGAYVARFLARVSDVLSNRNWENDLERGQV